MDKTNYVFAHVVENLFNTRSDTLQYFLLFILRNAWTARGNYHFTIRVVHNDLSSNGAADKVLIIRACAAVSYHGAGESRGAEIKVDSAFRRPSPRARTPECSKCTTVATAYLRNTAEIITAKKRVRRSTRVSRRKFLARRIV